jgi:endonuclease/exonuclease/phosphatase family metal-dependent hydrolase
LHQIDWKPKNDDDKKWMFRSRNILEVTVKVPNGDPMTFFVAHFPSQSNPEYWRQQAADNLTKLILEKGKNDMVVAAGDFNITHDEEQEYHLFSETMAKAGAVSHLVGCESCPGTHFYRKSWSFLDAQIYNAALLPDGVGSYQLEPNTIDVIRYSDVHLKRGKYPKRWDLETQSGVSDHFPLYSRLKKRSEAKTPVLPPPPEPAATPVAPTAPAKKAAKSSAKKK